MRRIAVSNEKGGTGKTTTAANLAHGLAIAGRRVLLVDLDSQGNGKRALGVNGAGYTIADVLLRQARWQDAIIAARENLDFIASGPDLADAKDRLIAEATVDTMMAQRKGQQATVDSTQFLARTLGDVTGYDYLILDCAPSRDVLTMNTIHFANEVMMPVSVDFLASVGAGQHTGSIVEAQQAGADVTIRYVLPTFYDSRRILSQEILSELKATFGKVVADPIPVNVSLAEAPSWGQTIFEYSPNSTGAAAYAKLVERVLSDD